MRRVIMESPYAGDVEVNVAYARACLRDCLERGEAPIASHLLYTQPGVLRDEVPEEREWGINAGLAWANVSAVVVFYTDRGWSTGMVSAKKFYEKYGHPVEERTLPGYVAQVVPDIVTELVWVRDEFDMLAQNHQHDRGTRGSEQATKDEIARARRAIDSAIERFQRTQS